MAGVKDCVVDSVSQFTVEEYKEDCDEDACSSDEGKITEKDENEKNVSSTFLKKSGVSVTDVAVDFKTSASVDVIMNEINDSNSVQFYSCYHCNRKFTSYRALDYHIKLTPLEELEMSLQKNTLRVLENCNSLPNVSSDKQADDKGKAATKNGVLHHCPICPYTSPRMTQLRSHILIMHTDVRPYKCLLCDYRCINNTKLKLHIMAIHTREKPHQCSLCDYKGTRSTHLKRHMAKYHSDNTRFKCTVCDFKGVSDFVLRKHMKYEHSEKRNGQSSHSS